MTTFISYSRVNSEFVVRLAKDLKAAGYDVWLDQLDIPKGARWDDAIETAVEKSSTFMIVLAPESIESQNVKDELSYAIDSGKHILPVVIRPCKIPLRLRRFQYVDFTDKPYKESLADIKRLLSNTQRIIKAPPEEPIYEAGDASPLVTGPLLSRDVISPPNLLTRDEEPRDTNRLQRFIIPVGILIVVLAAVAGVMVFSRNQSVPPPTSSLTSTQPQPTITSTNTAIPPPAQITDEHGVPMRLVSASDFTLGSDSGMSDEQPVQLLFLNTFYIDKYEVTNLMYKNCVDAGVCKPPKKDNSITRADYYSEPEFANYPVVYVDWYMAKSYCEWRGARLPTEAEWEKAARGPSGSTYPWGEEISCEEANYFGCQEDTASVSSFAKGLSAYGLHNMAGNVYEWVNSLYLPYPYNEFDGREYPEASGDRVIRGGSWLNSDSDNEARSARRQKAAPTLATEYIGFRCARTPNGLVGDLALIDHPPQNSSTATSFVATRRSHRTQEPSGAATSGSASPTSRVSSPTAVTPRTPTVKTPATQATVVTPKPPITPTDTKPPYP